MGIQPTQKERYEYRLLQCFQEREDRSRRRAIGDQMDGATVMSASNQRTLLPEGRNELVQDVSEDYVRRV